MDILSVVVFAIIIVLVLAFLIKTTIKVLKIFLTFILILVIASGLMLAYLSAAKPPVISEPIKTTEIKSSLSAFYTLIAKDKTIKEQGINAIMFSPPISSYTLDGSIKKLSFSKTLTVITAETAHRKGFAVYLVLDAYAKSSFLAKKEKKPVDNTEAFFANLEPMVLYYVELANKTKIERFTPFIDLGCVVGTEKAEKWHANMLQKIQEKYSGEIIASNGCEEPH